MEKWHVIAKRELRRLGITHEEVAQELGIGQSNATQKLNGKREADVEEIKIIARMIGKSLSELCENDTRFARNDEEKRLIDNFRNMTDTEKAVAIKMLESLTK